MRKRIYCAGPISKGNVADNVTRAHRAGVALLKAGFAPLIPHGSCFWHNDRRFCDGFHPKAAHSDIPHADWIEVDLAWVACSDAVLRLPGESVGADAEVAFAQAKGIPVFESIEALTAHFKDKAHDGANPAAPANGAAGPVPGETKAKKVQHGVNFGCLMTAAEDMVRASCKVILANDEPSASVSAAGVINLAASCDIFFELMSQGIEMDVEKHIASLRPDMKKEIERKAAELRKNPVVAAIEKAFA